MMQLTSLGFLRDTIKERCSQIFFRQSMINDIMKCPKMAMYRWVMGLEESSPYMAAILGTAGHEVIFMMHLHKRFDLKKNQILQMFEKYFNDALDSLTVLPVVGKNYNSIRDEFLDRCTDYIEMLASYQEHDKTREFRSTMHEQAFVLEVDDPEFPLESPFLFSGQLDQAGLYIDRTNETFVLRDIKFRDNAFRPDYKAFNFDPQMTIYASALKYGKPACQECKPRYEVDEVLGKTELIYEGPCEKCAEKIGTPLWPQLFPERCELIWMRDFLKYKRKYRNKQAGDLKGPGYIHTYRAPSQLHALMHDVVSMCREVRNGSFHRKPGPHCNMWCKYYDACKAGLECDKDAFNDASGVTGVTGASLIQRGIYSDDDQF